MDGMANLDRTITGNWGEDSVAPDPPSWRMDNTSSVSRDPSEVGEKEAVFFYVDEDDVVVYSYMQWRKIQSELAAGLQDDAGWEGTWSVLLPGAKVAEEFTVEAVQEVRHDGEDNRGVVYGHRNITVKGRTTGLTFAGSVDLLDV